MEQEFIYRKLISSDIPEYRRIRFECLSSFPENFGTLYEEEIKKNQLYFEKYIEDSDPNAFVVGVFQESKCIGICGFIRESKKKQVAHRGKIIQMYVAQEHHGKGIGYQLLKKSIQYIFEIPGMEQIILGVSSHNKSAIALYSKSGFQEYGEIKKYLKTEKGYSDTLLMILYK